MVPLRIQRRRSKGWRMPPNTVYVGRPTKWGNPGETATWFRMWLDDSLLEPARTWVDTDAMLNRRGEILVSLPALRGKNLACWCKLGDPCHADVLLELANSCATPPAVLPGDRRSAARSFPGSGAHPMGDA